MLRFGVPVLVVACYLVSTSSGEPLKCEEAMNPFDFSKFEGLWYAFSSNLMISGHFTKCDQYTYSKKDQFVKIDFTATVLSNGQKMSEQTLAVPDSKLPSKLFSEEKNGLFNFTINVLDTDYTNYAVMQTCALEKGRPIFEFFHVLSRVPNPDEKIMDTAVGFLKNKGCTIGEFIKIPQDCSGK